MLIPSSCGQSFFAMRLGLFLLLCSAVYCFSAPDALDETAILTELFQSTSGPNWGNSSGWSDSQHVCVNGLSNWYGVKCAGNYVQKLELSRNQLSGVIPASLGQLSFLDHLDLSSNNLIASIPSALCNLTSLETFLLNNNALQGSIPDDIGELEDLQYFDVSNNRISGSIPNSVGQFHNLVYFICNSNDLTGTVPSSLGNTGIEQFSCALNHLSGTLPSNLCPGGSVINCDLQYNPDIKCPSKSCNCYMPDCNCRDSCGSGVGCSGICDSCSSSSVGYCV
jgi:hypothetical protein